MNQDLRPEDFWPDAEKLLDKHFKAKRMRKTAFWTVSASLLIGASLYFSLNHKDATVSNIVNNESAPSATLQSSESNENALISEPKNGSNENGPIITYSNKATNTSTNSSSIEKSKTNNTPNTNSKSEITSTTNSKIKSNSNVKSTSRQLSESSNSPIVPKKTNETKLERNKSTKKELAIANSKKIETKSAAELNQTSDANINSTTSTKKNIDASTKGNSIQGEVAISTNANSTYNFSKNNSSTNPISPEVNSTTNSESNKIEIESRPFAMRTQPISRGLKVSEQGEPVLTSPNSDPAIPENHAKAEYRINVTAGANLMTKKLSGIENSVVELKRNTGETNTIAPQLNIEFSRVTDRTALSIGLSYEQYGENVNYDPSEKKRILIDNGHWDTYTTTFVDTDTNYVYGYVYFSQQLMQRLDSNYIHQNDSVDQTLTNANIANSRGTNQISYIEVPLTAGYYFGKKKFRYGITAGVSAGMLVYSSGYYINDAGNDVISFRQENLFRKFIVNGLVGIDLQYYLSPSIHLLVRPQYRTNLNSILDGKVNANQKYSGYGLSTGISFFFK